MNAITRLHPFSILIYTAAAVTGALTIKNPIFLLISIFFACIIFIQISPLKAALKELLFFGILMLAMTVINPIFNHRGNTPIVFINNLPITFEAIIYGVISSISIISVIIWCRIFTIALTTDMLLFLIGNVSPNIAVLISLALRFIPDLKLQWKKIKNSAVVSGNFNCESFILKIKSYLTVFSALITNSLENAVQTANSMKARGFELKNKTTLSIYKFRLTDILITFISIVSIGSDIICLAGSDVNPEFYPEFILPSMNLKLLLSIIVNTGLFLMLILISVKLSNSRKRSFQ